MYDRQLVIDILHQIDTAIEKILYRSAAIKSPNDFTDSPEGMEKLDSICMQLIAIGESVKNITILILMLKPFLRSARRIFRN